MSNRILRDEWGQPFGDIPTQLGVAMFGDRITYIDKFFRGSIGASKATLWDAGASGNFYPLTHPDSYGHLTLQSTSAEDAPGQSGLAAVSITGQDVDGNQITHVETLNGTGGVTVDVSTWSRVYRMFGASADAPATDPTSYVNVGAITVTLAGNTVAQISTGNGQTLMSPWRVPKDHKCVITGYQLSMPSGRSAELEMVATPQNGPRLVKQHVEMYQNAFNVLPTVPIAVLDPLTDLEFQGTITAGQAIDVAGSYQGILIKLV